MPVSLAQQIEEVERELKLREGVYARRVQSRAMRAGEAEFHIKRMRAVLATLTWLQEREALIKQRLSY
jgi:hypothetical protein